MGNSQPVAIKHYLQTTDEYFTEAVRNPVHSVFGSPGQGSRKKPENLVSPEKDEACRLVYNSIAPRQGLEPWT